MIVNSTELQNNFGKYLMLAGEEDIIVTRNGSPVARLSSLKGEKAFSERWPSSEIIHESAAKYNDSLSMATYEEFLELTKDNEERYEYINGQIYMLATPKPEHQAALMELSVVFYNWFQGKPCRPFFAPFDIKLRKKNGEMNSVEPDLMVICDLEQHLENGWYTGVPKLVVEVLSESTKRKDMISKLELYMDTGVEEYWIVDPKNKVVWVYLFENENINNQAAYKNGETALSFAFPGLDAPLERIFRV